jgi:ribonucleoside-diphosphate reductase alpha chain
VTLRTGQSLEVSKDHEMWVDDGNVGVKIKATDLKIGDKIPLISGESEFGKDHFPIESEMMGNLLGDGYINTETKKASWNFFGNDIPYGNILFNKAILLKEGHDLLEKHPLKKELNECPPDNVYNCSRTTFNSIILGRLFVDSFGFSKLPRRVPARIWGADKETVAGFLRGLYAADGNQNPDCSIVLAQNDIDLLKEIQLLLSCFGISAYVCNHNQESVKTFKGKDGTVRDVVFKPCFRLIFGGANNCRTFLREIGFGVPVKDQRASMAIDKLAGKKLRGSWRTGVVTNIEDIGIQETYCVTEPMTNTITVNGIVTGNCRHAMASVLPGYGFKSGSMEYVEPGYDYYSEYHK